MHPTTKTSKPAILMLAIGLTILTQVSAVRPSHSAETAAACQPSQLSLPATALQLPATIAGFAIDAPSVPASIQFSVCDQCRTICARSCTTYACKLCTRSIRCGKFVPWCILTKR